MASRSSHPLQPLRATGKIFAKKEKVQSHPDIISASSTLQSGIPGSLVATTLQG
jgi:4-aminobutyrate aminotransferase-like enzyme